ncbi:helix-turn-helix transcriptional regulator [Sporosarcina sp. FSL W8-0480]|uniref:helix-turn-helix domain-containing protein n=1 Tax=Sporosarcina sp. FSL W8-0480 TaxID=2954701 RepID=UPI0030DBB4CF
MAATTNFIRLVGEHLRMIRELKGINQEELAENAGIARARISEIENGKGNATLGTLAKVMEALEIAPMEIFNFQNLSNTTDITDKKLLIEIHRARLMERELSEIQYVIDNTETVLKLMDKKTGYGKK